MTQIVNTLAVLKCSHTHSLTYLCTIDGTYLCEDCKSEKHAGHFVISLEDAVEQSMSQMLKMEEKAGELENKVTPLTVEEVLRAEIDSAISKIREQIEVKLQNAKESLIADAIKIVEKEFEHLEKHKVKERVSDEIERAKEKKKSGDFYSILRGYSNLEENMKSFGELEPKIQLLKESLELDRKTDHVLNNMKKTMDFLINDTHRSLTTVAKEATGLIQTYRRNSVKYDNKENDSPVNEIPKLDKNSQERNVIKRLELEKIGGFEQSGYDFASSISIPRSRASDMSIDLPTVSLATNDIQIYVRTGLENIILIDIDPHSTVDELKSKISLKEKFDKDRKRLIFEDRLLFDNKPLYTYGIKQQDTIDLVQY